MPTKRERVEAVLQNRHPDHPPVCFWHHFPPDQATGQAAVDAHLRFFETYDLDFLKVMNDHLFPRGEVTVVRTVEDLKKLRPVPGDVAYGGQLEVLRKLREKLGPDVLMTTTLFNAWAVLRYLTQPPSDVHGPPKMHSEDDRDETITALLRQDRQAVRAALQAIGETLADTARQCILAGADGVFLSVRDDWVNRPANGPDTYDELLRDIDLAILAAASAGTFNFVHACGRPQNFAAFADYPAQVINWADRSGGPSIAYARDRVRPAIAAGVDNLRTLPQGTPEACAAEVHDALRQAQTRPIIIAAGCTFDPQAVPPENLHAVVAAARSVAG